MLAIKSHLEFEVLNTILSSVYCSTYEVATACALALGAEKLICIIDGPILDEYGRLIHFLTLQEADLLIRRLAKQSETAANYVKAVDQDDLVCAAYNDASDTVPSLNGKAFGRAKFQNGVGFDNGDGLWSGEQGFAVGSQERLSGLNGYLSELAAAAFVCRVSFHCWVIKLLISKQSRILLTMCYLVYYCSYVLPIFVSNPHFFAQICSMKIKNLKYCYILLCLQDALIFILPFSDK